MNHLDRKADREWCEMMAERNRDNDSLGDGVVLGVAMGSFVWIVALALLGVL